MIDLLLVNPKGLLDSFEHKYPPLGLNSIAWSVELAGFSVKVVDFEVSDKSLVELLSLLSPRFVGISGTTSTRFESIRIAQQVKEFSPMIKVVYGGSHASFVAEEILTDISGFDYVVKGEGEQSMVDLLLFEDSRKSMDECSGISYRLANDICHSMGQSRAIDLDSVPFDRKFLENHKYNIRLPFLELKAAHIMTSRGCPASCSFCSQGMMFGSSVAIRSPGKVVEEFEYCVNALEAESIIFFDSTLSSNHDHLISICNCLIERQNEVPWCCDIRASEVDREMLSLMKKAGCDSVAVGLESASHSVLKRMGKKIKPEQVESVICWCRDLEIKTKVFYSFGHIGETSNNAQQTICFLKKNAHRVHANVIANNLYIYPGTGLEGFARKEGILPDTFRWSDRSYPIMIPFETPFMTKRELFGLIWKANWAVFIRKAISRKKFKPRKNLWRYRNRIKQLLSLLYRYLWNTITRDPRKFFS